MCAVVETLHTDSVHVSRSSGPAAYYNHHYYTAHNTHIESCAPDVAAVAHTCCCGGGSRVEFHKNTFPLLPSSSRPFSVCYIPIKLCCKTYGNDRFWIYDIVVCVMVVYVYPHYILLLFYTERYERVLRSLYIPQLCR